MKAIVYCSELGVELRSNVLDAGIFVAIFIAIMVYALWPRNKALFDEAAKMPLRED